MFVFQLTINFFLKQTKIFNISIIVFKKIYKFLFNYKIIIHQTRINLMLITPLISITHIYLISQLQKHFLLHTNVASLL